MAKKKPVHHLKEKGIDVAVWENGTGEKLRYNTTLKRRYQDADGEWHDTDSFGRSDLPLASKLLDLAYSWIWEQQHAVSSQEASQVTE